MVLYDYYLLKWDTIYSKSNKNYELSYCNRWSTFLIQNNSLNARLKLFRSIHGSPFPGLDWHFLCLRGETAVNLRITGLIYLKVNTFIVCGKPAPGRRALTVSLFIFLLTLYILALVANWVFQVLLNAAINVVQKRSTQALSLCGGTNLHTILL